MNNFSLKNIPDYLKRYTEKEFVFQLHEAFPEMGLKTAIFLARSLRWAFKIDERIPTVPISPLTAGQKMILFLKAADENREEFDKDPIGFKKKFYISLNSEPFPYAPEE